jgi:hypothetical protein
MGIDISPSSSWMNFNGTSGWVFFICSLNARASLAKNLLEIN